MDVLPTSSRVARATLAALSCTALLLAFGGSASAAPVKKITWMSGFTLTEYFPTPEWWFIGSKVRMPGVGRESRVDWLYSARGIVMEGDGIGLDNQRYSMKDGFNVGWLAKNGKTARFGSGGIFAPFWRAEGYWKTASGELTFPLQKGGWFNGTGKRYVPARSVQFGRGASRALSYYRSIAVDPGLIPLGSLVNIPAYKSINKDGWFRAEDTGGAIDGRHIDVYRRPPDSSTDSGRYKTGQRVFIVPKSKVQDYLNGKNSADAGGAAPAALVPGLPPVPSSLLRPRR